MATIYIDGIAYQVDEDQNLLHVALSLGLDLPYFCWHPALGSVGACRQCAVKQYRDEADTRGRIVMACMTPSANGTRISIKDPEAVDFRAEVIEWLMVNHPHDCPICDEGGECHLQDMTVMTGHSYRRHRFNKRTYSNQYLGPFINHEMNRCIQCYRCVRFYREFAGGRDLDVFGAHDNVYFGRHADGVLESEFSGNLVEVCPTGVFTDKTLKEHYTRKWDLTTAPSVCVNCGLGCNTIPGERYGQLRRILNRYNRDVNGYFICDRGRFGYEFVNSERRIREPRVRPEGLITAQPASRDEALEYLSDLFSGGGRVIGIGSPRASLEANFALRKLVGAERFYAGVSARDWQLLTSVVQNLQNGPARSPSLHEVELADAALVLGEDLTNTAPMMALALRQSVLRQPVEAALKLGIPGWDDAAIREIVQMDKGPLYIASPASTKLDDVATRTYRGAPDDLARLGFAVAHAVDPRAPAPPELPEELESFAVEIAQALKNAQRPLVVAGTSCGSLALMQAAVNVAWALCATGKPAELSFTVPEPNSLGLALMGGGDLEEAHQALAVGEADILVILENDLYRRADAGVVDDLLAAAKHVVMIDHLENSTSLRAEVILPAATFVEGDGTFVNNEGRAQRCLQVFVPQGEAQESWRWLRDVIVAARQGKAAGWENLDDVLSDLVKEIPVFEPAQKISPSADFRIAGEKIPRQSHRFSGRTAMLANVNVHEPKPPDDLDTPLAFSMEGFKGRPPASLIARYWAPGWNSVQSLNKFQAEVAGPLVGGDPGRRLIKPTQDSRPIYFSLVPQAFQPVKDEWLVVPLYHIFGSEELSILSPWIAQLAPQPYLALNPGDAEKLQVSEGDKVGVTIGNEAFTLPVKTLPSLPSGLAGVPAGLPGLVRMVQLPTMARIAK